MPTFTMNLQKQAYDLLVMYSRQLKLNNTQYNVLWDKAEEMATNPYHPLWEELNKVIDTNFKK